MSCIRDVPVFSAEWATSVEIRNHSDDDEEIGEGQAKWRSVPVSKRADDRRRRHHGEYHRLLSEKKSLDTSRV